MTKSGCASGQSFRQRAACEHLGHVAHGVNTPDTKSNNACRLLICPCLFSGRTFLLRICEAYIRAFPSDSEFCQSNFCAQVPCILVCVPCVRLPTRRFLVLGAALEPLRGIPLRISNPDPVDLLGPLRRDCRVRLLPDFWRVAPSWDALRTPHCSHTFGSQPSGAPFGAHFRWTRAVTCLLICEVSGRACRFLRAVVRKLAARLPVPLVDATQADIYS